MEKINIDIDQTYLFVKDALVLIGYPENLEIITYIDDEGMPGYHLLYEKEYQGRLDKHLTKLSKRDFIGLMMLGMSIKGYQVEAIYIDTYENKLKCNAYVDVVSYGINPKRNRRRK